MCKLTGKEHLRYNFDSRKNTKEDYWFFEGENKVIKKEYENGELD